MTPTQAVDEAITSRRSIRSFLDTPVDRATVEEILAVASRAPSGTNMQPWQAIVLTGGALKDFGRQLEAHALRGNLGESEWRYYPDKFHEPFLSRRRKVGWDLYGVLGIARGETEKMAAQHARNLTFFGAPVGMIFTIDRLLQIGSWLDYGMFLQNVMTAARGRGLDTCPQAAFAPYHKEIRQLLAIPESHQVVCGMALGHAAPDAPEHRFSTDREPPEGFTRFVDALPGSL
ncbi:nitroreductase [uncultured Alsobacter sp.]|uniref:nitroreductase n=1 Tax=uncultured Alsobacter sp. TaxID=1748258 RepID=UPI0025F64B2C|nr:nitroreductase [uncultured Alsobacter sp.]